MMLDWDTLIAAPDGEIDDAGQKTVESVPACPGKMPVAPVCRDRLETNNGGACVVIVPAVPAVPAEKQGRERKFDEIGAAGGGAAEFFAPEKAPSLERFPFDPQAVVMVLALAKKKGANVEALAAALHELGDIAPGEQVIHWHRLCLGQGIKPWLLIHPKAPEGGMDCMGCRHISSTFEFIPDLGHRCFTWLCGLGYSIHVHDHAGERVLIAPPECQSWERWMPKG